jgi:hypothetical protein
MIMNKVLFTVVLAGTLVSSQAHTVEFTLDLDGPGAGTPSPATGSGTYISYDTVSQILSLVGSYGESTGGVNLLGDFTAAHIHNPDSSVFAPLTSIPFPGVTTKSGLLYATIDYSSAPAEEAQLWAGLQYVNIHTTLYPGGEIAGYLTPLPEPGTLALLGLGGFSLLVLRRRSCS